MLTLGVTLKTLIFSVEESRGCLPTCGSVNEKSLRVTWLDTTGLRIPQA